MAQLPPQEFSLNHSKLDWQMKLSSKGLMKASTGGHPSPQPQQNRLKRAFRLP
jgi:hypothetical protein